MGVGKIGDSHEIKQVAKEARTILERVASSLIE
jgi:hypothetical protein